MLDHEHRLNLERLAQGVAATTPSFFAFADTVSARNYQGTNECHGWMGVSFQSHPRDQDSQIIIHVRMLDSENALQQEALGIVGVNLLYGAFCSTKPELLIESLLDNLTTRPHRSRHDRVLRHRLPPRRQPVDEPEARAARALGRGDVRPDGKVLQPSRGALQEDRAGRARELSPRLPREHRHASQRARTVRARPGLGAVRRASSS